MNDNSGYGKVEIDARDRDKTTFTSNHDLYRFRRTPFGLKFAFVTFQRAVDFVLVSVRWQSVLVYLRDTVVFSKSFQDRRVQVSRAPRFKYKEGVTRNLKKCKLFVKTIAYLGHTLLPGSVKLAVHITDDFENLGRLKTQKELRSFFGLCNVFRQFVSSFVLLAAPLNKKMGNYQPENLGFLTKRKVPWLRH